MKQTIKQLEEMLKVRKEQKKIIECAGGTCVNCNPDIQALQNAIDGLKKIENVANKLKEIEEEYIDFCPDCVDLAKELLKIIDHFRKKCE